MSTNIRVVRHLDEKFANEIEYYNFYEYQCKYTAIEKVRQKGSADPDSYFGPYLKINQNLNCPEFYQRLLCLETDRIIITRYRTGSHDLKIQARRFTNTSRGMRFCGCGNNIQTLEHVLTNCAITTNVRRIHDINNNMNKIMNNNDYTRLDALLRSIENILAIN